ncbi:protein-cysteine N-palmitoyltransferase HHAT isoform X1 [Dermacentor silvarum]|uniref:protein-cysteine N-palmitoyltransferase HHAT isoform X1 n=1 Tax=Dermacentor silvarum TaxID=543639 RepID=UPI00189B53EE|nr:protein-cysteine N-palmitoyltransferase HHAT isoform X1 [Dermacentor silvarum]
MPTSSPPWPSIGRCFAASASAWTPFGGLQMKPRPRDGGTAWPTIARRWRTQCTCLQLFLGPVQNYSDFADSMEKPKPSLTFREVAMIIAGLLRSGAHFLLMDLMCHYFYSAALSQAPKLVPELDNTSLLGFGAVLVIMFYSKYLIHYGVSGGCARIEGHNLPAPPKCIARGHQCSHFWRYFDHGLHLWIKKYIYLPIVGTERKVHWRLLGIAVAFTFIWIWHSMTIGVTFWATLSAIGVALEVAMAQTKKLDCAKSFEAKYLNPERTRILKAILGSPLSLLTMTACLFYLIDLDTTTLFLRRVLLGFPVPLVPVLVALYFGAYASQDVMEWETASARAKVAESQSPESLEVHK